MIRHLHPTDTPALLRFKQRSGAAEVCSLAQAIKGGEKAFPVVKYASFALSPRAWQSCWVQTRRTSVQAVLRAGPRSGRFAWELSELYLAGNSRDVAVEVLEQLAFPAGTSGARRIFLRMRSGNDLFSAARSAGYQPVFNETLYRANSAAEVISHAGEKPEEAEFRQLETSDQHGLFRLFCASVPIDIRTKTGQTLDEWSSSQETAGRKRRDWGLNDAKSGSLQAHIASWDVSGGRYFSVRSASGAASSIGTLIRVGLQDAGDRPAFTMVPSYDNELGETLMQIGFTPGESYDVMVKTLAVPVTEAIPGFAVVER